MSATVFVRSNVGGWLANGNARLVYFEYRNREEEGKNTEYQNTRIREFSDRVRIREY